MTTIRLYNTLTKTKEELQTVKPGHVGMYLCGPTVYKEAHIGHMVGPVIFDTVKRFLVYSGYQVTWVVNITDVDDKLIAESNRRGISMFQVATQMTADYLANLQSLGVDQIDHLPRATDNMDEIIAFIEELIARDFAYANQGDVFFDVTKDAEYGRLSNRSVDAQQGEGGEAALRKRSPGDFALWKSAKPGEPAWDSPWGQGRPGWHIECSAMSRKLLGKTFDIHGGGLDLVFPHHENELAQSRCCHGQPMVRYWMHNGLMRAAAEAGKVGGRSEREKAMAESAMAGSALGATAVAVAEVGSGAAAEAAAQSIVADASSKISRSKGDGGLAQLIERHTGERIRFFLLRSHYRSTSLFGEEGLQEAGTALEAFYRLFQRYERVTGNSFYKLEYPTKRDEFVAPLKPDAATSEIIKTREAFLAKLDDDFNTGGAVSELFELTRILNRFIESAQLEDPAKRTAAELEKLDFGLKTLRELGAILGIFLKPPKKSGDQDNGQEVVGQLMQLLIELRASARQNKDFAMADAIRKGLTEIGITLQDLKGETTWEKVG